MSEFRPGLGIRIGNRVVTPLLRAGLPIGPMFLLTVPQRIASHHAGGACPSSPGLATGRSIRRGGLGEEPESRRDRADHARPANR